MSAIRHVTIYTDGACIGNPGPGGYGAVLLYGSRRKELSGGFRLTTNNRMELMAAIAGLETLKGRCKAIVYTDSRYVADAVTLGWARRWKSRGWRRGRTGVALNPDLWERLLRLCDAHEVEFRWVAGHAGDRENERCDELATTAAQGKALSCDSGYEDGMYEPPRMRHRAKLRELF
jgi:ribonuclease HI